MAMEVSLAAPEQALPLPIADPQTESALFRLPREIRDQIYADLFRPMELFFADTPIGDYEPIPASTHYHGITHIQNPLAILRTCRRVHDDIGYFWLEAATFFFKSRHSMLDKLTPIPSGVLSHMRHLHLSDDHTLTLSQSRWESRSNPRVDNFSIISAFRLLTGLRLDTLTIRGVCQGERNYEVLHDLVHRGQGWRELRYISPRSEMLGFSSFGLIHGLGGVARRSQPNDWQNALNKRDGPSSEPSVTIYRSTVPGQRDSVLDPSTRTRFEQEVCDKVKKGHTSGFDAELTMGSGAAKGIMVVVRRGADADYRVKVGLSREKTWGEKRPEYISLNWLEGRAVDKEAYRRCFKCRRSHAAETAEEVDDLGHRFRAPETAEEVAYLSR